MACLICLSSSVILDTCIGAVVGCAAPNPPECAARDAPSSLELALMSVLGQAALAVVMLIPASDFGLFIVLEEFARNLDSIVHHVLDNHVLDVALRFDPDPTNIHFGVDRILQEIRALWHPCDLWAFDLEITTWEHTFYDRMDRFVGCVFVNRDVHLVDPAFAWLNALAPQPHLFFVWLVRFLLAGFRPGELLLC